jgi:hypothetical protein
MRAARPILDTRLSQAAVGIGPRVDDLDGLADGRRGHPVVGRYRATALGFADSPGAPLAILAQRNQQPVAPRPCSSSLAWRANSHGKAAA